jgi:uncharacterized protein YjbI with pentapeptide repeats
VTHLLMRAVAKIVGQAILRRGVDAAVEDDQAAAQHKRRLEAILKAYRDPGGGVRLRDIDMSGLRMEGIELPGADLRGVNLQGAELTGANLEGADLSGADLSGAYLMGARLAGANLRGAKLLGTGLADADLSYADLTGALRSTRSPTDLDPGSPRMASTYKRPILKGTILPDGSKHE